MAAGDWEYRGVTELQPEDAGYNPQIRLHVVEAHRLDGKSIAGMTDYVRVQILGEWAPDSRDMFNTLQVTVDGISVPDDAADDAPEDVLNWITPDSSLLRGVPFRRLLMQASADLRERESASIGNGQQVLPVDFFGGEVPDFRALRAEWPKGDTERVASWAGHLYATAVADGQPATKAVQDAFGVSRRTAQRMIGMARELGFLADDVVGAPVPSRTRKGHDNEQGTS
ncbi:DUF6214 family protein [Corynebacterium variabile]|uniref:DUF6214 family protein n=1 Tax=Corynebacterium variabile TaxID=1727 RepID=UPI003FD65D19